MGIGFSVSPWSQGENPARRLSAAGEPNCPASRLPCIKTASLGVSEVKGVPPKSFQDRLRRLQVSRLNGALERLYRDHRQPLYTCALAVTRCPERAEDALQEAFYRLFRLERAPEHLKAYVFRTVRNAAVDIIRRSPPPSEPLSPFIFDSEDDPRETAEKGEFKRRVSEVLLTLSENERETIVQHLWGELTFQEIAQVRGSPLGTVSTWYRRGMEKLRVRLEE